MKKVSFLTILIYFLCDFNLPCKAQDKIVLRNGKVYNVRIIEVGDSTVFFENKAGEKFTLYKSWVDQMKYNDLSKIKFLNKKDTIFNNLNTDYFYNEPAIRKHIDSLLIFYKTPHKTFNDYYLKGEADAFLRRNYDGIYRAAFLTTLIFPPIGFIVSYSMLMAPPQMNPLYITDPKLLREEAYLYGYKKTAYKQKSIRVWKGFTLGLITGCAVYYLILK